MTDHKEVERLKAEIDLLLDELVRLTKQCERSRDVIVTLVARGVIDISDPRVNS